MRLALLCVTTLFLCTCAKVSTEFSLYFYPPGTGLKDNDWSSAANVNVDTRSQGLLRSHTESRLVISFTEKGAEPEIVYTGAWAAERVQIVSGVWTSAKRFQLEFSTILDESVTARTTLEIEWPNR